MRNTDINNDNFENETTGSRTVVVTGVGGVVGRNLLDHLLDRGYRIRVLSRNVAAAKQWLPVSVDVQSYENAESALQGAYALVHLAARNNDQVGSFEDFRRDNVGLTIDLAGKAKAAGVKRFVFATTTKALSGKAAEYGRSKAMAERDLANLNTSEFRVSLARLCPVYGEHSRGKINKFQQLPLGLGNLALTALRSLVAIVSAKRVSEGIANLLEATDPLEEKCLADPVGKWSVYGIFTAIVNVCFVLAVPTVLAIPCLIAAAAIVFTSRGGVLFMQRRLGITKRIFRLCKFRTMVSGTPIAGTHEVGKSYVTGVGSLLRKFKIDELPQAFNVAKRDLNLIGPRPGLENQLELTRERERYGVFDIRPGITGYGQVAGVDMSEPRKLAIHDHRYGAYRSILLDLQIAIKTVLGGGFGDPIGGDNASAGSSYHDSDATNQIDVEVTESAEAVGAKK